MSANPELSGAVAEYRMQAVDARYHAARNMILVVFVLGVLSNLLLWWVASGPERPGHALMQFARAEAVGPTALCPGDTLRYDLALHVAGPGVFDLDVSVWRVTPPSTVLFSQTRRMVFDGPAEYTLGREWVIPEVYSSPVDGSPERWAAGQYTRRHAIVTVSRSTEPSIVSIPFSIRQDCP